MRVRWRRSNVPIHLANPDALRRDNDLRCDQLGFDVERAISEWERNLEEPGIGPVSLTYEEERVLR